MNNFKNLIEFIDLCWQTIPTEMKYIAINKNGGIWAFCEKPITREPFVWDSIDPYSHKIYINNLNIDILLWDKLIFQRPTTIDFSTFSAYNDIIDYLRDTDTQQQEIDFAAIQRWYLESHEFAKDTSIKVGF